MKSLAIQNNSNTMLGGPAVNDESPSYPELHLTDEQLDALGISKLDVGDEVELEFKGRVSSKSVSPNYRSMSIELREGDVEGPKGVDAAAMFPTMTVGS